MERELSVSFRMIQRLSLIINELSSDVRDEFAARDFLSSLALFVVDPSGAQPDVGKILL
jgi:hypothetical protein